MATARKQIIDELEKFIEDKFTFSTMGISRYQEFYVGIAEDPKTRLKQHGVKTSKHKFKWWTATSPGVARMVEHHFHDAGCKGQGGGGANANKVYVYRMEKGETRP